MNVSETSTFGIFRSACVLRKIAWLTLFIFSHANSKTLASTLITNYATATYKMSGVPETSNSNLTSYRVDELLNFTLVVDNPAGVLVQSPSTEAVLSFTLKNEGNGNEDFTLSLNQSITDEFDPSSTKIYLDTNNNASYDAGTDLLYTFGVNVPRLAPDASMHIFVVCDTPASLQQDDEARVSLVVSPATGDGAILSVYPGAGDGGVDALMGSPGGNYAQENKLIVEIAKATLTKSQSVLDPDGGSASVQGSIITYTLKVESTGSGTLSNLVLSDPIPSGTSYVSGSLSLDATQLTDAADSDRGVFNGTGIRVSLPTISTPTTHTVIFKVRIL